SSCVRVEEALLCAGYVQRHSLSEHQHLVRRLYEAGAAVKDMGAGALMLAHVAAGRFDAYIEPHMHPWDALAGLLLVEESGGRAWCYPGAKGLAAGGAVLAAATGIFGALLAALRAVDRKHMGVRPFARRAEKATGGHADGRFDGPRFEIEPGSRPAGNDDARVQHRGLCRLCRLEIMRERCVIELHRGS